MTMILLNFRIFPGKTVFSAWQACKDIQQILQNDHNIRWPKTFQSFRSVEEKNKIICKRKRVFRYFLITLPLQMWLQLLHRWMYSGSSPGQFIIIFWEHSWMAAPQRLLRRHIHFKSSNGYTYFTFLTLTSCLRRTSFHVFLK